MEQKVFSIEPGVALKVNLTGKMSVVLRRTENSCVSREGSERNE